MTGLLPRATPVLGLETRNGNPIVSTPHSRLRYPVGQSANLESAVGVIRTIADRAGGATFSRAHLVLKLELMSGFTYSVCAARLDKDALKNHETCAVLATSHVSRVGRTSEDGTRSCQPSSQRAPS